MLPADGAQIAMLLKSNHTIEVLDLRNNQLQARASLAPPSPECATLRARGSAFVDTGTLATSTRA